MTKEKLISLHSKKWELAPTGSTMFNVAAQVSIQYAIGILEEVKNNKNQGIITDESVYQKIHDLKSLLK